MAENICDLNKSIHQLNKLDDSTFEKKDIYPISLIQSTFDATSGTRLDAILACFNFLFIPYAGTSRATRLQIPLISRRKSLIITYRDIENNIVLEQYIGEGKSDEEFGKNSNWRAPFTDGNFNVNIDPDVISNIVNEYLNTIESNELIVGSVTTVVEHYLNSDKFLEDIAGMVDRAVSLWFENNDITDIVNQKLNTLFNNYINSAGFNNTINSKITDVVNTYFNSDAFTTLVTDKIQELVQPVIDTIQANLQKALDDNERVVANALSRHEEDLLNLKS